MFRDERFAPAARLLALVWLLAGCTLLNPHVTVPQARESPSGPLAGGLDVGIRDANALSDAYYAAVGQQSTLRNGAALALLPLSAAALGVGITSTGPATQQALAGLGLGGATLFAGTQYLTDRGRQLVWLKGSEALGCAVRSMWPEMVTPDQLNAISQQIDALATDLGMAEQGLDPAVPAQAAALDRARTILAAARQWRDDIALSGEILEIRIRAIRDRVSEQILRTEPDLNAILAAAGSLRTLAPAFAPGAVPAAANRPLGFHRGSTADDLMQKLATDEAPLAGALAAAAAIQRVLGGKDDCLPADAAAAPVLLGPSGGVTLARGQSVDVPVRSSSIPRVALSGLGAADLSTAVLADGGVFVVRVTASSAAAPGVRTLMLMDQAGQQAAEVTVTVTGAATGGGGQAGGAQRSANPARSRLPGHARSPVPLPIPGPAPPPADQTCAAAANALNDAGFADCATFDKVVQELGGDPRQITSPSDSRFRELVLLKRKACGLSYGPLDGDWPKLRDALLPDGTCRHGDGEGGFAGPPAPLPPAPLPEVPHR